MACSWGCARASLSASQRGSRCRVSSAGGAHMKFPNETRKYRTARAKLLREEIALRRRTEKVAAARRKLPMGGEAAEDYVFESERGPVRLSELFGSHDTLVAYSFMYGPKMAAPCPMCSSMLDGLNGNAKHIGERASLVVIAKSPIERILGFARPRGWDKLRLVSSAAN